MDIPGNRFPYRCLGTASLVAILAACSAIVPEREERAGVAIRSLNYSAREIDIIGVVAPDNPKNEGGGDALNPYGAGGSICCFSIPSQWRPDLKVLVEYRFFPESGMRRALVNVPPYPDGKAGEIWLIVHADESVEAVVSNYSPSRPEWPGKIKGWPEPSREYRLKIWERDVARARDDVNLYKKLLGEFSGESIKRKWKYDAEHDPQTLQEFKDPDDPAYAAHLKNDYQKGLNFFSKRLESLLKNKP